METYRESGNWGLYTILNYGEGVGFWNFKVKERNLHEDGKTNAETVGHRKVLGLQVLPNSPYHT